MLESLLDQLFVLVLPHGVKDVATLKLNAKAFCNCS